MFQKIELTHSELTTIVSVFQGSMYKLEESGDYPEKGTDKIILRKLIDMKYFAMKRETNDE